MSDGDGFKELYVRAAKRNSIHAGQSLTSRIEPRNPLALYAKPGHQSLLTKDKCVDVSLQCCGVHRPGCARIHDYNGRAYANCPTITVERLTGSFVGHQKQRLRERLRTSLQAPRNPGVSEVAHDFAVGTEQYASSALRADSEARPDDVRKHENCLRPIMKVPGSGRRVKKLLQRRARLRLQFRITHTWRRSSLRRTGRREQQKRDHEKKPQTLAHDTRSMRKATWRYETNSRIGIFPGHMNSGTCLPSRPLDLGLIETWQVPGSYPGPAMLRSRLARRATSFSSRQCVPQSTSATWSADRTKVRTMT